MFAINPLAKIYLSQKPVDFRKGIDGLLGIVKISLGLTNLMNGDIFVFFNRNRTSIKIVFYDGQGFWLCQKRLSTGRFPKISRNSSSSYLKILATELIIFCQGGDFTKASLAPQFLK